MELNDQIEKFEKLELQTRGLKRENRILEKFLRIETRSPQDIMDEFRTGMMSDRQFLSGYQTDLNNTSPKDMPPPRGYASSINSIEPNIF